MSFSPLAKYAMVQNRYEVMYKEEQDRVRDFCNELKAVFEETEFSEEDEESPIGPPEREPSPSPSLPDDDSPITFQQRYIYYLCQRELNKLEKKE